MRREPIRAVLIGMLLVNLAGCGGMFGRGAAQVIPDKRPKLEDVAKRGAHEIPDKRRKLDAAVKMIEAGQEGEARRFLELVIDDSRVDGVTDEALFRLAILNLNGGEQGDGKSSIALLDTLRSSYPASVWTKQAAPLHSYLVGVKNIRIRNREFNALREKNLSLSRDVRELRETIDRLKALDRDLEKKIRH